MSLWQGMRCGWVFGPSGVWLQWSLWSGEGHHRELWTHTEEHTDPLCGLHTWVSWVNRQLNREGLGLWAFQLAQWNQPHADEKEHLPCPRLSSKSTKNKSEYKVSISYVKFLAPKIIQILEFVRLRNICIDFYQFNISNEKVSKCKCSKIQNFLGTLSRTFRFHSILDFRFLAYRWSYCLDQWFLQSLLAKTWNNEIICHQVKLQKVNH